MVTATPLFSYSRDMDFEISDDRELPDYCHPKLPEKLNVSRVATSGGKPINLVKALISSACERNCYYCPFRAGRDYRRNTFKPDELAASYMSYHHAGVTDGIFISSGIVGGGVRTQDLIIDAAEILRNKYHYRDYLHLKIMPGAEKAQLEHAMLLADRVSINLEAPNDVCLKRLAPYKHYSGELLAPLLWAEQIRKSKSPHEAFRGRWPSTVTQFVVGAVGETDQELLTTSRYLYRVARLKRVYYSKFRPIQNTPLENQPAENPMRELRLYQATFLLRDYRYELEDLQFDDDGNLDIERDPKQSWAEKNLASQPLEINRATYRDLIRVPGIGPKGAKKVLSNRKISKFRYLDDLRKLGLNPDRIAAYVLLDGKRPIYQQSFW
jgi:predicted DNA-binding helix-hairpin-helix protein